MSLILQNQSSWVGVNSGNISGCLSYWKMNEGTGSYIYDSVGTCTGSLTNGVNWIIGRTGSACYFDGINDFIQMYNTNFDTTTRTVSLWIKPAIIAQYGVCYARRASNTFKDRIYLYTNNRLYVAFNDSIDNVNFIVSSWNANEWHHVVVICDGTSLTLYTDGIARSSDTTIGTYGAGSVVFLGNDGTNEFNGAISDVLIFNRVLTNNEIQQIYKGSYPKFATIMHEW